MEKVKTPQDKKALSLKRDRRNVYGESTKGTRIGIPRSKQQSKQAERRAAQEPVPGELLELVERLYASPATASTSFGQRLVALLLPSELWVRFWRGSPGLRDGSAVVRAL